MKIKIGGNQGSIESQIPVSGITDRDEMIRLAIDDLQMIDKILQTSKATNVDEIRQQVFLTNHVLLKHERIAQYLQKS